MRAADMRTPMERWVAQQHDRPLDMFQEQLARSIGPRVNHLPSRTPDERHRKWLMERRLEQEHVMALAERYERLNDQCEDLSHRNAALNDALAHTGGYVKDLESQLSNYKKRYGDFDGGECDGSDRSGGVEPTTRPIQASREALRHGDAPQARGRNGEGDRERHPPGAGVADSGRGQSDGAMHLQSNSGAYTDGQQVDQEPGEEQGPERPATGEHRE